MPGQANAFASFQELAEHYGIPVAKRPPPQRSRAPTVAHDGLLHIYLRKKSDGHRRFRVRDALYEKQGGKCHWCARTMNLRSFIGITHRPDAQDELEATIDHLFDRHHPERSSHNKHLVVLACWACNQERNRQTCKALSAAGMR